MTRGDRFVISALALALALIGGSMLVPASSPDLRPASPSIAPAVPYREGVVGHPSSINPLTPRSQADQDLVALLFRGLVRAGPDGSMLPDLATGWTVSDDGRTYTFQLATMPVGRTARRSRRPTWRSPSVCCRTRNTTARTAPPGRAFTPPRSAPRRSDSRWSCRSPDSCGRPRLPILPQHLLAGVTAAELANSGYSARPVGDGPYRLVALSHSRAVLQRVPSVVPADSALPSPSAGASPGASLESQSQPSPDGGDSNADGGLDGNADSHSQPSSHSNSHSDRSGNDSRDGAADTPPDDRAGLLRRCRIGGGPVSRWPAGRGRRPDARTDRRRAHRPGSQLVPYRWTSMLSVVLNQRTDHPGVARRERPERPAGRHRPRVHSLKRARRSGQCRGSADPELVVRLRPARSVTPRPWDTEAATVPDHRGLAAEPGRLDRAQGQRAVLARPAGARRSGQPDRLSAPRYRQPLRGGRSGSTSPSTRCRRRTYLARLDSGDFDAAVVDFEVGLDPDLEPAAALVADRLRAARTSRAFEDKTLDQLLLTARKTVDPVDRQTAVIGPREVRLDDRPDPAAGLPRLRSGRLEPRPERRRRTRLRIPRVVSGM